MSPEGVFAAAELETRAITVLHLGCGRRKTIAELGLEVRRLDNQPLAQPIRLINLDASPVVEPDIVCELGKDPIPLPDDSVDLVIANHVIEHIGEIGKVEGWFYFWGEIYRVMRPKARLQFECPYFNSVWAWADPTHVRAISEYTFLYLNQDAYKVGGAIPDYRPPCDFVPVEMGYREDNINEPVRVRETVSFIRGALEARKPFHPYWQPKES